MRERDPRTGRIVRNDCLGRRFCNRCGIWKHLCYFRPRRRNGKEYPHSDCDGCHNRGNRAQRRNQSPLQRQHQREYDRIYKHVKRREAGVPQRGWRYLSHPTTPDERLPIGPFRDWLSEHMMVTGQVEEQIACQIGFTDRSIRRWLHSHQTVTLQVVDQVTLALTGDPGLLTLLYT